MKDNIFRTLALAAMMALPLSLNGQSMEDAINFCEKTYYGTARSIGMGNAVTAVGSDMGSILINPASAAVANCSEAVVSGTLVISTVNASAASSYLINHTNPFESGKEQFGAVANSGNVRFGIPNFGANLRFDMDGGSAIRNVNFGLVMNSTGFYNFSSSASCLNKYSTFAGMLATFASADKLPKMILSSSSKYNSGYNWNQIVAYQGGLINYNDDDTDGNYFGSTESVAYDPTKGYSYGLKGTLDQCFSRKQSAYRYDVGVNLSANLNDCFYFGMNLGLPTATYRMDEYLVEAAASDKADFAVYPEYYNSSGQHVKGYLTYFDNASYEYLYNARVTGIYASFGFIWLPNSFLRLGGSVSTPAKYTIVENYQSFVKTTFEDYEQDASAQTDLGESRYSLRTPYSFSIGAACTFGPYGLLSIDYELQDFSIMKYRERFSSWGADTERFVKVNRLNSLFCHPSHNLRVGGEFKPHPAFAIRGGFNLTTSPQRYCTATVAGNTYNVDAAFYEQYYNGFESGTYVLNRDWKNFTTPRFAYSFGVGYSSRSSFYIDLTARLNRLPDYQYHPYSQYISNDDVTVTAPVVNLNRSIWDVVLTLGFRL